MNIPWEKVAGKELPRQPPEICWISWRCWSFCHSQLYYHVSDYRYLWNVWNSINFLLDLNKVELQFQGSRRGRRKSQGAHWIQQLNHACGNCTPKSEREKLAKLPLVIWDQEHHAWICNICWCYSALMLNCIHTGDHVSIAVVQGPVQVPV